MSETHNQAVGQKVAQMLLDIQAVHISDDKPFIFTSGKASPVYIDCRKIISFPEIRRFLMQEGAKMMREVSAAAPYDAVAGGETAGIPFAAFMAERLALPMQYVRKKPKGFGRNAQIEGHLPENSRVLLVEDLATDGGSKFMFADALRKAGAECNHVFVVFYYDIFAHAREELEQAGLQLHYLASWWDVLEQLKQSDKFDDKTCETVEAFLRDPKGWSAANGGNTK